MKRELSGRGALALKRETVRTLTSDRLGHVMAGNASPGPSDDLNGCIPDPQPIAIPATGGASIPASCTRPNGPSIVIFPR